MATSPFFIPGGCTYKYSARWGGSYPCGWLVYGDISSSASDPSRCYGARTCVSSSAVSATTICNGYTDTPRRTTGYGDGRYYIGQTFLTNSCSSTLNNGTFSFNGASITNTQTGTSLTMTCQIYLSALGTWSSNTTSTGLPGSVCYRAQIRCYHAYLNDAKFASAGSTASFWTQDCQPCY